MKSVTPLKIALVVLIAVGLVAAGTALAEEKKSGWLGVSMQDLSPAMAKALQLEDEAGGVLVSEVVDESPAAEAGLADGDVIVEFDGHQIDESGDLSRAVRRAEPGEQVEVVVLREGRRQTLAVEVGEREDDRQIIVRGGKGNSWMWHGEAPEVDVWVDDDSHAMVLRHFFEHGWLGVELQELNEQLGDYFGIEDGEGVLIAGVEENSPAAEAGLETGDVIVAVDGEKVESQTGLLHAMRETEPEQDVEIGVVRRGERRDVTVTLGEAPAAKGLGNWYSYAPRSGLHRIPGVPRAPHVERWHEFEIDDEELDELRDELRAMREELKELREEIKK